jgi:hypothetical protein
MRDSDNNEQKSVTKDLIERAATDRTRSGRHDRAVIAKCAFSSGRLARDASSESPEFSRP